MARQIWLLILCGVLSQGCATNAYLNSKGHRLFQEQKYIEAAQEFEKSAEAATSNLMLYKLDAATSYFSAEKYKEATDLFLAAEKIAEIKDYTSVSEEVGTLLSSDNVRGYKGEDFEKVLINVYLALSFAALGKVESAQVEARKINQILYRMIHEGKRGYSESPFARYLAAILWEASGEINSAYIDYKHVQKLDPEYPEIGADLLRTSRLLGFHSDYEKWQQEYPETGERKLLPEKSELIVVFQQGLGPKKIPRGENASLPRYIRRYSPEGAIRVLYGGDQSPVSQPHLDIEKLSIDYLEDRIGRMAAKKLLGTATKAAVAAGVGAASDNEDLGWLMFLILSATDQVDLRHWRSLPASLHLLRLPIRPGNHDVSVEVLGPGSSVLRVEEFPSVRVAPGEKRFLVVP